MAEAAGPDYGLLDRTGLSWQIFYPRRDFSPPPKDARDIMTEVAPGVSVASRFYAADPVLPTVLYFHGNGEVASDYDDTAPFYHESGTNLWVADYRGYGASGGSPSFASLVGDAHPVLDAFHKELDAGGFNPARFIMGRSLGSHPALELAARRPERLRGLIIESGAASLRRLLTRFGDGGAAAEAAELAEQHRQKVASIRLPALILHGEWDELVPVQTAIELYDTLRTENSEAETELVIIPGAGHNDILWVGLQQYFNALAGFVARYTTVGPSAS